MYVACCQYLVAHTVGPYFTQFLNVFVICSRAMFVRRKDAETNQPAARVCSAIKMDADNTFMLLGE